VIKRRKIEDLLELFDIPITRKRMFEKGVRCTKIKLKKTKVDWP